MGLLAARAFAFIAARVESCSKLMPCEKATELKRKKETMKLN